MKKIIVLIAIFISFKAVAQEDYNVEINGEKISMAVDKQYQVDINGKKVSVKISLKDTLLYNDNIFSFQYLKDYKVSRNIIDTGIEQVTILTAEGNGILIQKYSNINPSKLNELMLGEITKESINYGFVAERKDYKRTILSGQVLEVNKAVLKYKDEVNTYEVATIGRKDEGILVMTIKLGETNNSQGEKIIDLLWKSISYK